jgi:hypothetical protein
MLWWLLAGAGVLVVVTGALLYNRLVRLRNMVDNAWSQVDVQLRHRYDLIPNLVATVKAYATHESETLGAVVRARDGTRSATTIEEQGTAESALTEAIGHLLAVASVGTREFTATLLDLIRRGVLEAQPVSVKKGSLWGEKTMTDLRVDLGSGESCSLKDFERRVLTVAKRVLSDGPVNLTDFEERIKDGDDREAKRSYYESFRDAVKREVERRDLVERSPGRWLGWAAFLLGLAGPRGSCSPSSAPTLGL